LADEDARQDEPPAEEPAAFEEPAEEAVPAEEPPPHEPAAAEEQPSEEPPAEAPPPPDDAAAEIKAIDVGSYVLLTVTNLTSIAYGKLGVRQLEDARGAIDAIAALVPVLEGRIEPQLKRDLEQALANLQVAYVDASARG
jgi:hypothetical protein